MIAKIKKILSLREYLKFTHYTYPFDAEFCALLNLSRL